MKRIEVSGNIFCDVLSQEGKQSLEGFETRPDATIATADCAVRKANNPWKGLKLSCPLIFLIHDLSQEGKQSLEGFETIGETRPGLKTTKVRKANNPWKGLKQIPALNSYTTAEVCQEGKQSLEGFETCQVSIPTKLPLLFVRKANNPWKGLKLE